MEKKNVPKNIVCEFDECEEEMDFQQENLEFDADDVIVQAIDGVVISNNDDEIKMLFFFIKPGEYPEMDDRVQCKAIAEFRTSPSKFLSIVKGINEKANDFKREKNNCMFA